MKKFILASLLLSVFLFLLVASTSAQSQCSTITNRSDCRKTSGCTWRAKTQKCDDKAKGSPQKCERRVDKKINKFSQKADHPKLNRLLERLSKLIDKLKAKGHNTSQLETDLAVLKTKIEACRSAHAEFINKLKAVKAACSDKAARKAALAAAKAAHKAAKTACRDARAFFRVVVRQDLKALKSQINASKQLTPTPTFAVVQ